MKITRGPGRLPTLSLLILPLLLHTIGPAPARPQDRDEVRGAGGRRFAPLGSGVAAQTDFIIELTEPGVIEGLRVDRLSRPASGPVPSSALRRMDLRSVQADACRSRAADAQQSLRSELLRLPAVRVLHSVELVMNALVARAPAAEYRAIRRLPGVKRVYRVRELAPALDTAAQLQGAAGMWDRARGSENAGHGVKIGIIDSGIDLDNPMFTDDSLVLPPGFPKGETALTNRKVIVARNYLSLLSRRQTVSTAIDERGHGSFVAGCAAGRGVTAPLASISGMAPGAFLGSYKVFGTPGINDYATDAAIIAATNDAVGDGMDVLNYSLGDASFVPPAEDPLAVALENAIEAGVVVVGSAGNSGPNVYTIGSPHSNPATITVGAVSNSRGFAPLLHVTAPIPVPESLATVAYQAGDGPQVSAPIPSTQVVDVTSLGDNGLACSPLPSRSLTGRLAFVSRGECTFRIKVLNATAAGASAVVIYNNVSGAEAIPMGQLSTTTIPAVMISNPSGLALRDFMAANPDAVQARIDSADRLQAYARSARVITDFSSRGPGTEYNLKPDLVAVGENVYSAAQNNNASGSLYDASQFATANGTSFSGPMVAGAAAVLKQLHPELGPAEIKSMLVNTASRDLTLDGIRRPSILEAGSGLLDMSAAASAGAVFSPPTLSFGANAYSRSAAWTRALRITNISGAADQFVLTVEPLVDAASVTLSAAQTPTLPPGGSAAVELQVRAAAPQTGGIQGFVTARSLQTSFVYRVPYWAAVYVPDPGRTLYVGPELSGPERYANLSDALAAARPGNAIEIVDSDSYAGGLVISSNGEGLPLDGITIRAAAGSSPTIDGSGAPDGPNIRIVGLQHVLLQGLQISGGGAGVNLTQYPGFRPASVTLDHCLISNPRAGFSATGVEAEDGGDVSVTHSTVAGFVSTGVVVSGGARLTILSSHIENNGFGGVDASDSNLLFLDSTVGGNYGEGLYLDGCTGSIERCTVSSNRGVFGTGIRLGGGQMTLNGNTVSANDLSGISLQAGDLSNLGTTATLNGNTIQANKVYGVQAVNARDLRADGNMILANGRGVLLDGPTFALLRNNFIVRSSDTIAGDGIRASGSSNVRSINNTVYLNGHVGLVRELNATLGVFNTIAAGNRGGDTSGLLTDAVRYSLIGDGSRTGNNNLAGDPRFVSAATDVFEPAAGSPALDAGSDAIGDFPFLDFDQRLRVATPGARAGEGIVDLGAVEAGSAYPLLFPILAQGSPPPLGDDFTTGFAVLNDSPVEAGVEFMASDPQGKLLPGSLNPSTQLFPAGTQLPVLVWQLLGLDRSATYLGAILARSTERVKGFFLVFDNDFARFSDGVDVSGSADTALYFMKYLFDSSGEARCVVFNPSSATASVTATAIGGKGEALDTPITVTVEPKGQTIFRFNRVSSGSGYLKVTSDRPVSGLELYGNRAELGALRAVVPGSDARLYFSHFAVNAGFSTTVGVINTANSAADLVLRAFHSDGSPMGDALKTRLAPGAQLLDSVAVLFGVSTPGLVTGYLVLDSSQTGMIGFTSFSYTRGSVQSTAAVPAMPMPRRRLVFSHVAHNVGAGTGGAYQTGIALLNPSDVPVPFTMKVFDGSGLLVAETTGVLRAREQAAKVLSHPVPGAGFFTQPFQLGRGHIEVTTEYGLLGFELFYREDFSQLSGVPAQDGN